MSIILFFKVFTIYSNIQDSFSSLLLHFTHPETQRLKVGGTSPPFSVGWSCHYMEAWLGGHVSGGSVTLLGVVAGFQLRAQLGLLAGAHQFSCTWHLLAAYLVAETSLWESKPHTQRVGVLGLLCWWARGINTPSSKPQTKGLQSFYRQTGVGNTSW